MASKCAYRDPNVACKDAFNACYPATVAFHTEAEWKVLGVRMPRVLSGLQQSSSVHSRPGHGAFGGEAPLRQGSRAMQSALREQPTGSGLRLQLVAATTPSAVLSEAGR